MSMSMWITLENGEPTEVLFEAMPDSEASQFGNGQSIPRHLPLLDEAAGRLGVTPLNDFAVHLAVVDESLPPEWFDPEVGLVTVRGLLRYLETASRPERIRMAEESLEGRIFGPELDREQTFQLGQFAGQAILADLRRFEVELAYARDRSTRFHFLVSY